MPSWKKVITSGSAASLSSLTTSGNISGSSTSTGSFGNVIVKGAAGGTIEWGNAYKSYLSNPGDSYVTYLNTARDLKVKAYGYKITDSNETDKLHLMAGNAPKIYATTGSFRIYAGASTMPGGSVASDQGGGFGFLTSGGSYTYDAITSVFTDNNTSGMRFFSRTNNRMTQSMEIYSDGDVLFSKKVGINTANPTYDLEITGTGDNQFFVGTSASKYFAIRDDVIRYYGMQSNGMRIITNNDASIKHGIGKGDFKVDDSTANTIPRLNVSGSGLVVISSSIYLDPDPGGYAISGSATSTGSFGKLEFAGTGEKDFLRYNYPANPNLNVGLKHFDNGSGGQLVIAGGPALATRVATF